MSRPDPPAGPAPAERPAGGGAGRGGDRAAAESPLPRPFTPAAWAPGPHAQTVLGKLLRPAVELAVTRERWDTPDADFVDVDLAPEPAGRVASEAEAPVVLVLHGLEGSTRRRYVRLAFRELDRHGIRAVGLNFRSCSGEPNRLARSYHSGDTGDLAFVLGRLRERFPGRRLGALGFSLGGNVLLKLLGELGPAGRERLGAAVVISVPYDLAAGARALETSFMGRLYGRYFLRSLRRKVRAKAGLLAGHVDVRAVLRAPTVRAFDELATAPLHGFRDASDYYERSSSSAYLAGVGVRTLLLHSVDDPFLPRARLPEADIAANDALVRGWVPRGGHVGFVEGSPLSPRFWAEAEAARFLARELGAGRP